MGYTAACTTRCTPGSCSSASVARVSTACVCCQPAIPGSVQAYRLDTIESVFGCKPPGKKRSAGAVARATGRAPPHAGRAARRPILRSPFAHCSDADARWCNVRLCARQDGGSSIAKDADCTAVPPTAAAPAASVDAKKKSKNKKKKSKVAEDAAPGAAAADTKKLLESTRSVRRAGLCVYPLPTHPFPSPTARPFGSREAPPATFHIHRGAGRPLTPFFFFPSFCSAPAAGKRP